MNHRMKIKERQTINKYLNLAKEFTKLYNMKVMILSIIIGALETAHEGLEKRLVELKTARMLNDF